MVFLRVVDTFIGINIIVNNYGLITDIKLIELMKLYYILTWLKWMFGIVDANKQ